MLLRAAQTEDAPAIATILSNWIDETDWMPRIHSVAEDRGFGALLIERTEVEVAEMAGRVAGFLALQGDVVQALYVTPARRRQGIGKVLLDRAMARHARLTLWVFQANTGALAFYAREGFVECDRTDGSGNDEGLPDIRMIWQAEAAQ